MDRRQPVRGCEPRPLAAGYGNHREPWEPVIGLREVRVIQPAMRRRHRALRHITEKREMQEMAQMEMHDVEVVGPFAHFVEHRQMRRYLRLQRTRIETKRPFAAWHQ